MAWNILAPNDLCFRLRRRQRSVIRSTLYVVSCASIHLRQYNERIFACSNKVLSFYLSTSTTMPSSYILEPPSPSDFPDLAAIQVAGFSADLRLTVLRNVSNRDYEDWGLRALRNPEVPSGTVAETMLARDKETGRIVGWARWSVPDGTRQRPEGIEPMRNALPAGTDSALWDKIRGKAREIERAAVGNRQYICKH
jgi:hypothetical protein